MAIQVVSILIPAFNASKWIAETLESALSQTHPHCEIIVVDDGSTDNTLIQAEKFTSRGVTVISQTNAGAAAARNHALRHATGDFIQFLDADDILAPEKIARQLDALGTATKNSIAAGPWGRFTSSPSDANFTPEENWCNLDPITWLQYNFSGRGMMPPIAWLAPLEIISAAGPWDETLSLNDDGEYYCRVLLASKGIIFCSEALSYYRSNIAGSLSTTHSPKAWDSALRSQIASASQLLKVDSSPPSKQACADMFARLAHSSYPDSTDVSIKAEELASQYGGSTVQLGGSLGIRLCALLFGWRAARRLQIWARRNVKP